METEPVIGIDLGTTNSEVSVLVDGKPEILAEDGAKILPSVVGLDPDGNVVVGRQALNQLAAAPERTVASIKRKMGSGERVRLGDQEYLPQEISGFILRSLKDRAERSLGRPVRKAVITVPAYFTDAQRQATREAGRIAGLDVRRIINEPTAAALAYECGADERRTVLVYDLGGGTFDVSVVSIEAGIVEVLASTGDNRLGGNDFDDAIVERLYAYMAEEMGVVDVRDDPVLRARLQRSAEKAKIELSERPHARVQEDHVATVDGVPKHLSYELDRHEFESLIESLLDRTVQKVSTALTDANAVPSQLDKVLLVGGSTRIPKVSEVLRQRLGQEPHGEVDPDLCVAFGAGVQAGMEMGLDMDSVLVDITPYTFGTSVRGELYGMMSNEVFVPIIRRNSKLPATAHDVFYTWYEDQDEVIVRVFQGEDPDARRNLQIGSFRFEGLNSRPGVSKQGLVFTYSLDLDGLLHVRVLERGTGREIRGVVEDAFRVASEAEIAAARERIDRHLGEGWTAAAEPDESEAGSDAVPEEAPRPDASGAGFQDTLERAEAALESAAGEDRDELVDLMEDMRDALQNADIEAAERLRAQIEDILFFLE